MERYLVLGSAPYMQEWVNLHLDWFVQNGYKIVTFNNSWYLLSNRLNVLHEYHASDDHEHAGTFVMDHDTRKKMGSRLVRHVSPHATETEIEHLLDQDKTNNVHYRVTLSKFGKNTMFFDMVQYFIDLTSENQKTAVVFVGCDMIYKNTDDTFYNHVKGHKARPDIVLAYDNDFTKVDAEFRDKFAQEPCKNVTFYNASEFETRLPFARFVNHLKKSL